MVTWKGNMLVAINPATGQVAREAAPDDAALIEQKLARASAAYETWRRTTFSERAEFLNKVAAIHRARSERLGAVMTEEMGKPLKEARGEIEKCAKAAEFYASNGADFLAPEFIPSDAAKSYVQYLPLGTVLGILPWNSPFWLAFRVAIPALMAGNACLIKPDPHLPGCAQALADAFRDAGGPQGLFDVLLLDTPQIEPVIRDPRIAAVSFTGSSAAGSKVARIAASEIKPAVLELGGSDPAIILRDADLPRAAEATCIARTICAGQSCIAAKRVLVEDAVHDEFLQLFQERLRVIAVGDPREESTDMGPIARADLRENLHRQVTQSIEMGACLELGGVMPQGPGFFYPVTLLSRVTPDMAVFQEETFGPVAAVTKVANLDEALRLANQTEYGLASSIWTSSERGAQLAREIQAGQVVVNGIVKTDPRLPSGGIKRSGYGRELGPHGIREFTNAQQVWIGN